MKNFLKIVVIGLFSLSFLYAGLAPKVYPQGGVGEMVKLGEQIALHTDTHPLTKDFVGNKLNCASCHLKGEDGKPGTANGLTSWLDTATSFPAWSKREKSVQTLQDRSNNCFMRSMNGKRLVIDSKASIAIASYITWLSTGKPINMNVKGPWGPTNTKLWPTGIKHFKPIQKKATHINYVNGEKVFKSKCAMCHGQDGKGIAAFPPLWGKNAKGEWLSYNTGAGMSKLDKGAAYVKLKMPLNQEGSLSDQEAADVMLFVNAQERANFDLAKGLLPKEEMGYYNSNVLKEKHSVRSNFKALGLDIDVIRNDKKIK
ncbi:c-type cytochrome [Sulfurospirillum arcachonense]|uniref:c-type cytochrome n=1 Tax=Sulfurospirillum arcachonense TaxID=57666 RepID=UPI000468E023|nr:c-type cytochrome [Sulfurospirillum arcachonense]